MITGKTALASMASVQLVSAQLRTLGLTKSDFAQKLALSQDYVYRILNGRSPFPRSRELIERIADMCQLDPYAFAEYRAHDEALPVSTRLVWERMRERGMSREDLFVALEGRISRPYFNSILRGDQSFPTTRAFIQLFALALGLPPSAFREFGPRTAPRRTPEQVDELEDRVFDLFFDVMAAAYGYATHPLELSFLDTPQVLAFFLPRDALTQDLGKVLSRMGELGMGFTELLKISGLPRERLAALFTRKQRNAERSADIQSLHRALRIA